VLGVRCIGLNEVGSPGHLVAILFEPQAQQGFMLAEYGASGAVSAG
jgi:hypothetical protein